ncbi:MAG: glutamate-1-semialdehyde 2,1-aminomutase [Actinobacteria bacterium]|nr:glutamate-1-semialdehyde 2,1-aminomutase [Actinomycetota bacterium]
MNSQSNSQLMAEAREVIPGGVNSPVRAFGPVGIEPRFIARAAGARLWDVEGKEYIDFVGSWGPLIHGHAYGPVVEAVCQAAGRGTSFGAPTAAEVQLARLVCERVGSVEMVRLVNSGTEATMTAVRLARAFTSRSKIIKFIGGYHGHADTFLVKAGSGAATLGTPTSPGVPKEVVADSLTAEFNDLEAVRLLFKANAGQIAAVIVEPVCGNAGVIPPQDGFLQGLRELSCSEGAVLIFDEVMTGFRVGPSGAQGLFGITPDLTTFGKIIGGGLPIGAIGGRAEIMKQLAPVGPVYQAGTLSGNPIAVAAGLASLRALDSELYNKIESLTSRLENGFRDNLAKLSLPFQFQRVGSMACLFFTEQPVINYAQASSSDTERFAAYFRAMLERGIYLPPSQFEAFFISAAHSPQDIDLAIEANLGALRTTT